MSSLRTVIYGLGAVAAVSLALLVIQAVGLTTDVRTVVTWIFWVSFIALLVALYMYARRQPGTDSLAESDDVAALHWPHVQIDGHGHDGRPGDLERRRENHQPDRNGGPQAIRPEIAQQPPR